MTKLLNLAKITLIGALASLAFSANADTLKIAVGETTAEILEQVREPLHQQGLDLELKVITDYVTPNIVTFEKEVDANFFQHLPYLERFNKEHNYNLVPVFGVLVAPIAIYSQKYKSLNDLPNGATIAIPNDSTNAGRTLQLLQSYGLIKLKDPKNILATARDIVENPKKLKIQEVEATITARLLPDVAASAINGGFAIKAGLNALKDSIALESKDSPYVNYVVTRPELKDDPRLEKLKKALYTKRVYDFIVQRWNGSILPTFTPLDAPEVAPAAVAKEHTEGVGK